jgi:hypothetical protein
MATTFMAFHVASDTEGLPATHVGTSEWLLTRVAVRVNAQTRWAGESLVTGTAHISVLVLGIW